MLHLHITNQISLHLSKLLSQINVSVPLLQLMKVPVLREQAKKILGLQEFMEESHEDAPVVLQTMSQEGTNGSHNPFFITLVVNDLLLHNSMLDYGESTYVMPLTIMNQLGIKTSRPYHNICTMNSREIGVLGLIKDIKVSLVAHPDISVLMDILVNDVPASWGILLSRN